MPEIMNFNECGVVLELNCVIFCKWHSLPSAYVWRSNDNRHSTREELSSSCMTLQVIPSFTFPQLKPPPKELMQIKIRDVLMDFPLFFRKYSQVTSCNDL